MGDFWWGEHGPSRTSKVENRVRKSLDHLILTAFRRLSVQVAERQLVCLKRKGRDSGSIATAPSGWNLPTRTPSSLITTPSPRSKQSTTIKCNRSSSAYGFLKASQPTQFQLHRPNSGPDSQPLSKTRDSRRSRRGGLVGAEGNYREKRIKNTVTLIPCLNCDSPFMKTSPRVVVGKERIPGRWSLTLNFPFLSLPFLSE
jgi:hypothetical protein